MSAREADPQPRENLLKSKSSSPMRFMKEYLLHDSEVNSLVRFRGPFIMPDWSNVEESEYVVQNTWTTIQQIAYEYYGDTLLMWVIAARNNLDLPDVQLYNGKVLKIPNRDWIEDKLLKQGEIIRNSD